MNRFTDSPYEALMKQKPKERQVKDLSFTLPQEHPCYGCIYSKNGPCVGICYQKIKKDEKYIEKKKKNLK